MPVAPANTFTLWVASPSSQPRPVLPLSWDATFCTLRYILGAELIPFPLRIEVSALHASYLLRSTSCLLQEARPHDIEGNKVRPP